jgi:translation initiation factor 2A
VAFSPKGSFLLTFQRPLKPQQQASSSDNNTATTAAKNLRIWEVKTGKELLALHQKLLNKDHWPTIQYDNTESLAFHAVTNTLHIYNTSNYAAGPCGKLPIKGLFAFSVCPITTKPGSGSGGIKGPLVATYVAESKGAPGYAALYDTSPALSSPNAPLPDPICRKSFFRASECRLLWSPAGTAVLAWTAADVDATNQSYYGEQHLYFLAANGTNESKVDLPKEGPVHDVQWNPKGDSFVVVAGFMPAKSIVFNDKCVPKYDLGSGPYALARWNPWGRFLVLAGFGNLPGDLAFFDKKADGKLKPMGTARAENGVTLEWSPDGRYILCATVAPRLRVDNGFQVFKYNGEMVVREKRNVLLEAGWVPVERGMYEDKPQSPRAAAAGTTNGGLVVQQQQPAKPTGYVPPHLRNNPAAAARVAASFSLARDPNDKGGKIKVGQQSAAASFSSSRGEGNLPPGVASIGVDSSSSGAGSKTANKNAKKRAAKKKAATTTDGVTEGMAGMKI